MAAGQTAIHHAPCFQHVAAPIQLVARRPAMIVQGSVPNRTQAQWSHSAEEMMLPCCHVSRPPSTMPRACACPLNSRSDCSKHRVRYTGSARYPRRVARDTFVPCVRRTSAHAPPAGCALCGRPRDISPSVASAF
ncbi:hypothetical protein K438DRAFT_2021786 [Mycena galopus ATCC 62051]|nr:hypothetical protein K438DRAFT_2021786 [Mycena galopus ATCC 62051]